MFDKILIANIIILTKMLRLTKFSNILIIKNNTFRWFDSTEQLCKPAVCSHKIIFEKKQTERKSNFEKNVMILGMF